MQSMRIYPYGVARNRLSQAARRLGVPAIIVDEPGQADALVTLRSYYRKRMQTIMEAETRNIPIYVLRSNTVNQMQQFLGDLFNLYADDLSNAGLDSVLEETRQAIHTVMNGERWVELHPGHLFHSPHAAPDGPRSQPGLAFLWQRAKPPRPHLP